MGESGKRAVKAAQACKEAQLNNRDARDLLAKRIGCLVVPPGQDMVEMVVPAERGDREATVGKEVEEETSRLCLFQSTCPRYLRQFALTWVAENQAIRGNLERKGREGAAALKVSWQISATALIGTGTPVGGGHPAQRAREARLELQGNLS
jgi:hypothetical protein